MRYRVRYKNGHISDPLDWQTVLALVRYLRATHILWLVDKVVPAQDPLSRTTIFDTPALQGIA